MLCCKFLIYELEGKRGVSCQGDRKQLLYNFGCGMALSLLLDNGGVGAGRNMSGNRWVASFSPSVTVNSREFQ